MLHVLKKWQVLLTFDISDKQIVFYIYDDHYSNVVRKMNEISFEPQPSKVEVKEIDQRS